MIQFSLQSYNPSKNCINVNITDLGLFIAYKFHL
jgi:hypothetical protein